jgi:N6-L-threonylcarbamoyladenine synthase/protein kinase Bud32
MDFSFSGIMSAAKDASDGGEDIEDICFALQENIFAMLTEVAERALSLTGSDELVLGGGVGQNERLREMLATMCEQRGAQFYAPDNRFLRDNAGMIAVLGATMCAAGDTLDIEESGIDADFRPDQVPVTWREREPFTASTDGQAAEQRAGANGSVAHEADSGDEIQGAEATISFEGDNVVKTRNPRAYRHPTLDEKLRRERTREEARLTSEARRAGVPTPVIRDIDPAETTIVFQHVGDCDLRAELTERTVRATAESLAAIHEAGFVHGDPTTRNVRVERGENPAVFLIDFGLGYYTQHAEDHAMDLHVFEQSLDGTADDAEQLRAATEDAYREAGNPAVLDRLEDIEGRGRYQ